MEQSVLPEESPKQNRDLSLLMGLFPLNVLCPALAASARGELDVTACLTICLSSASVRGPRFLPPAHQAAPLRAWAFLAAAPRNSSLQGLMAARGSVWGAHGVNRRRQPLIGVLEQCKSAVRLCHRFNAGYNVQKGVWWRSSQE